MRPLTPLEKYLDIDPDDFRRPEVERSLRDKGLLDNPHVQEVTQRFLRDMLPVAYLLYAPDDARINWIRRDR